MHTMNVYFSVVVTSNAHCKDIAYYLLHRSWHGCILSNREIQHHEGEGNYAWSSGTTKRGCKAVIAD